jgi:putative ATP-dependent endonuclease of OLD family
MKITHLNIQNYRNLSGLDIFLNPNNNFIVGENNLGKSNFLQLLSSLFTRKSFYKDDFTDTDIPIEIKFTLQLEEAEVGVFEDLFDPTDSSKINLRAVQNTTDDPIEFWHIESNNRVPASMVKCLNFLYYDSVRNPSSELSFNKSKGVGKFLHHIIIKHLENIDETDGDFVDEEKTDELAVFVNSVICKVKAFSQYSITATVERDVENLLSKILILKDGNDKYIHQSGYGVQFLAIITLAILQKILETVELKRDRGIFEYNEPVGDVEVKKSISLIIGFDEPEIHLHPYLQRSLVKYISKILNNREEDFTELLQTLFGLNKVVGQSIIATHSPNIILNDYSEIMRFYKTGGIVSAVSGVQVTIEDKLKKHLDMQFPFLKEAFFARFVLVVEGITEYSALPSFGIKLGYDFDEYGISVIEAGGKESVEPILTLLGKFNIPCLGIVDKDEDPVSGNTLIRQTTKRDFEVEIISFLFDSGKESVLQKIVNDYTGKPIDAHSGEIIYATFQTGRLEKVKNKYSSFINPATVISGNTRLSAISPTNIELKKLWYLTWFLKQKDIVLGGIIGENLSDAEIPQVYKNIINDAILLS